MGEHLVNLLSKTENEVYVTSRKQRQPFGNVRYIQGNAHDFPFLEATLKGGYDVIVDFMAYGTEEFKTKYMLFLNSCVQYVFLSSSRAYADSKNPITEESPLLADVCKDEEYISTDEYALAKGREENILRASGKTNWTIIRPYITYSEQRLQLGVLEKEVWLYRALHGRTIVFSEDIASKYTTLTYGLDVARGIASLLGNKAAIGQAFHITAPKPIKWSDVLNIYLDELEAILGKRPKVMMQRKCFRLNGGGKWQVVYDRLFDRRFNNNKISGITSTDKFLLPNEGLRHCLREFCQKPDFRPINWREQVMLDRMTGERAKPREFNSIKTMIKYYLLRYIIKK